MWDFKDLVFVKALVRLSLLKLSVGVSSTHKLGK